MDIDEINRSARFDGCKRLVAAKASVVDEQGQSVVACDTGLDFRKRFGVGKVGTTSHRPAPRSLAAAAPQVLQAGRADGRPE